MFKQLSQFIKQGFSIMISPEKHWTTINADKNEDERVFNHFFVPGLVLVFLSVILGEFIFDASFGFVLKDALIRAFRILLLLLMTFIASTMILYEVSRWYKIPIGFDTSKRLIIYAMFPLFLALIITGAFPFLYLVNVLSLYFFYLVFVGVRIVADVDVVRKPMFFIALFTLLVGAYLIIALLLSILTALIVY